MKSILISGLLGFTFGATAQELPVSQSVDHKKVVIEEFTAYRCGFCPSGHENARIIGENLGEEEVLVIGYHVGSLANPVSPGDPDFRTNEGESMRQFLSAIGTPTGPVNRGSYGTGNFVNEVADWSANATVQQMDTADANVALNAFYDPNTRNVNVEVEVYYTNPSQATQFLTVGYTEDGIIGPQTTYNTTWNSDFFYPNGDYYHRHVFRGFLNSADGDSIDASVTLVQTYSYQFTVPNDNNGHPIDINSLEFFALVHEGLNSPSDSEIVNAAKTAGVIDPSADITEKEIREILVSPNPSNGNFIVEGITADDQILLHDSSGRMVLFERNGEHIFVGESGYYFLSVSGSEGSNTVSIVVN